MVAGVLTIDGTYQGENIYVQNPFVPGTDSFCIRKVVVNGKELPKEVISSSAFEIDLSAMNLRKGQYVEIVIHHSNACYPRVLNPEALIAKSTFELVSFSADEEYIYWTTRNETSEEPFYVEQFRNNKWVVVAKVKGQGAGGYANYKVTAPHHSGLNRYRLKQRDLGGRWRYSEILEYKSSKEPVTFYPKRASDKLYLSAEAEYEIYDAFGYLVKEGRGKEIDISDLAPGVYYINVDNRTEKFVKR